jgi:hypothetical protein
MDDAYPLCFSKINPGTEKKDKKRSRYQGCYQIVLMHREFNIQDFGFKVMPLPLEFLILCIGQ